MKVVIVGGGAGGATCAARLRRISLSAEILILEKTDEISVGTCGLPYFISGVIQNADDLRVATPEWFENVMHVDVKLNTEVVKIDRKNKNVVTASGEVFEYDKLVLATGAKPFVPNLEGKDLEHVFSVRHLYDAVNIKKFIADNNVRNAAIVGGGFIGVEMAENLHAMGIKTTIVEMAEHVMSFWDHEVVCFAENKLRSMGVDLVLGDGVAKIYRESVVLHSGKSVAADIVIMAIGIKPETKVAADAGIGRGINNAIKVDEYLRTNDKNIFACGDSIVVKDFVTGDDALIALAAPANKQGRIIADNIAGKKQTFKPSLGTAIAKIFDLTVARVGNNEEQLISKKIDYKKVHVWVGSHAGYYPGAQEMMIKMLFNDEGKIWGAQIAGGEGVDKRIDVIATFMRLGGTVQDMVEAELAYAPPYSSAKDAINILGMVASNDEDGYVKPFYGHEFGNAVLVDVRSPEQFAEHTIEGAVNIPLNELGDRIGDLPKKRKIILFCNRGKTGYMASRVAMMKGVKNLYNLSGGLMLYDACRRAAGGIS